MVMLHRRDVPCVRVRSLSLLCILQSTVQLVRNSFSFFMETGHGRKSGGASSGAAVCRVKILEMLASDRQNNRPLRARCESGTKTPHLAFITPPRVLVWKYRLDAVQSVFRASLDVDA